MRSSVAAVALCLNVALILFGWRRYADLQHETEKRIEGEVRAQIIASTDGMTGLLNRKGFGDKGARDRRQRAAASGSQLAILSLQLNRFKTINDRFGYDVGDAVLRRLSDALEAGCSRRRRAGAAERRRIRGAGGDPRPARSADARQAIAAPGDHPARGAGQIYPGRRLPRPVVGRPRDSSIPDLLRRADIAMDHAKSARSARPMWFDSGMERELIAQSEIEQGIRFGLDHDQFLPLLRAAGRPCDGAAARGSKCLRAGTIR